MLRGIHTVSKNWIGRIITAVVLGLIAVSFAVWGIGDIFRGFGRSTVAKIGSTEIGIEQFRQTYNDRLQQLSRRLGRPIPPDQARALGLDRQLLGQLLAESALDENVRDLRLNLSNAEIAKRVTSDPNFRGPSGQFDRNRFEQTIRQAGYTEGRFVAEQMRVTLRRQIAETVTGGLAVPQAALDLQYRFRNEERTVDYVVLGAAQAGDIADPAPDVLAKYFEDNKVLFRAPEYRKLTLLTLSPDEIARWSQISDADAKKYYEDQRVRYVTPERRGIEQIVFPTEDEARAAADKLGKGATFAQLAAERGMKQNDVSLGMVTKSAILDRAVADAAFSLKPDTVSEPVKGRFGTVLVHVGKIEPEKVRPYEEVADEIKRQLALEKARAQVLDQHDKIEDERGGGTPLAQIAEKLKMTTRTIDAVDRSGRNPEGNVIADLPQSTELLPAAFASDVGVENDVLKTPGNGYVWYDVVAITPSRERPLAEVKDKVIERWRNEQIAAKLKAKAAEMADKLKGGVSVADVAASAGAKAQTAKGIKRRQPAEGLSNAAVADAFRLGKGEAGSADGAQPTERIVLRVTEIDVPKLDPASAETKQLSESLRAVYVDELLAQYVTQLEVDLGTTINESALAQVLGGGPNN